jgi:DNA-binding PadR family transcriptional regulator
MKLGRIEIYILNNLYVSIDGKNDINNLTFFIDPYHKKTSKYPYRQYPYTSLKSLIEKGLITHINKDKKKRHYPNIYKITEKGKKEVIERNKKIDWEKRRKKNFDELIELSKEVDVIKKKTKNKDKLDKLKELESDIFDYIKNIDLYNIPYVSDRIKLIRDKFNKIY